LVKQYQTICDLIYKQNCLTDQQRTQLQVGFYMGTSVADCKAAYDEAFVETAVRAGFANRSLDDTAANACLDALTKFTCDDTKKVLANATAGNYSDPKHAEAARTLLGYPQGYTCTTMQGNCLAEPACNLNTVAGACAAYKIAPLKDTTAKAVEATDAAAAVSVVPVQNCGTSF
jgi:hypothetical protein